MIPAQIAQYFPGKTSQAISSMFSTGSALHLIIFAALIIFFTYFYTAIIFNPIDTSDNLRKYGAFIPGVRPGRPTALYIDKVLTRITLPGAVFMAIIAVLPTILMSTLRVPFFKDFGGTSLLITVGVALETVNQLESQLLMRHYEGFLK
jgi:preprotein translocase subunit SecY